MTSNRKVKRRLKKKVLIALIISLISLIFLFVAIVKATSNNVNTSLVNDVKDNKAELVKEDTETKSSKENGNDKEDKNNAVVKKIKSDKPVIIIDPAFGGEYAGSKGYNGVLQKDVNLDIALNIKKTISRYDDVEVYLTRETDETVAYDKRISLIKEKNADVVVSIQQNTEGSGKAEGVETYILKKADYPESDSSLGYNIQKAMTMYSSAINRGVMTRNTDILKDSYNSVKAAGAVIYTGFITNEKESKNLTDSKYIEKLSEGIAQGILMYVDKIKEKK